MLNNTPQTPNTFADVDSRIAQFKRLLTSNNTREIGRFLRRYNTLLTTYNKEGKSGFYYLIKSRHASLGLPYLKDNLEFYVVENLEASMLYLASQEGCFEIVVALLNAGADKNKGSPFGGVTPLYIAAEKGYIQVVKALVNVGADKNKATTDDAATPLYIAAQEGHINVVRALLDAGADKDKATTDDGTTPLFSAAGNSHFDVVEALLSSGLNLNSPSLSPLSQAISNNNIRLVEALARRPEIPLEALQSFEIMTQTPPGIQTILEDEITSRIVMAKKDSICLNKINDWPICPISHELVVHPVSATTPEIDKNVYESRCILMWLKDNSTSPFTRKDFKLTDLQHDARAALKINDTRCNIDPYILKKSGKNKYKEVMETLLNNSKKIQSRLEPKSADANAFFNQGKQSSEHGDIKWKANDDARGAKRPRGLL